jgi:hypothetical protein
MGRLLPFLLLLFAATLQGDPLTSAQHARALLGEGVRSRVLRIECKPDKHHAQAPLYALVFVLEGRLWFYTASEGTQSLSLEAGQVERDMTDPAPLLRTILPGFIRFADVTDLPIQGGVWETPLPNGCFIECLARWHLLQGSQMPPNEGGLLAFYFNSAAGLRGHTVLVYQRDGCRFVYDPETSRTEQPLPPSVGSVPLQIARAMYPSFRNSLAAPEKAQLLALRQPSANRAQVLLASEKKPTPPGGSGRPLGALVN